ncbi:WXG100 family type VII secretion target [Streptomyces sp. NBC_01198]|uniref:WXG100 family type VII secretion target n=1 Tax=Streptomyces sp. NBC_01198 TaxID=2903769 RepID=UPI002E159CA4|nr:type VII secretion target [Streptomyces sp. NBC_01198]
MTGFNVHPPTLHKAGTGAGKINDDVTTSKAILKGTTPTAVSAHGGWAASSALQECLTTWEDRLSAISGEIERLGTGLHNSADDYQQTDEKVARLFRQLARELD